MKRRASSVQPEEMFSYVVPDGSMTDDARVWALHELKAIMNEEGKDYFRMVTVMVVIARGWATAIDREGGSNRAETDDESD